MIQCKGIDAPADAADGRRILVERLWPLNCPKEQLAVDDWLPDVAPSADLHGALRAGELDFAGFTAAYRQELAARPGHWWGLLQHAQSGVLTLIFTAEDQQENHAVVLAQWLEDELDRFGGGSSPVCYRDEFPGY